MRRLHTFCNSTIEGMANSEHAEFLFLSTRVQVKEPEICKEAWLCNIPKEKNSQRDAIEKELSDMNFNQEIWYKIAIKNIPPGRKLIGSQ